MPEALSLIEWLQQMDFEPGDGDWFDFKNVRVVTDDTDIVLHVFSDERRFAEEWRVRFRDAPASVIIPVIESALMPEPGFEVESSDRQYSWEAHGGIGFVPASWECPGQTSPVLGAGSTIIFAAITAYKARKAWKAL
jgi:hypothetical protein